jgi:hypothetical protein
MGGLLVPVVLAISLCGKGTPALAVSYGVQHDVDTGVRGMAWALDTYTRTVRVWREGRDRFCSVSTYDGSFTSTRPAGVRGTLDGMSTVSFRARFAPRGPLKGFLGVKDFRAGAWDWIDDYFRNVTQFRYRSYAFKYRATESGTGTLNDMLVHGKETYTGEIRAARPKAAPLIRF